MVRLLLKVALPLRVIAPLLLESPSPRVPERARPFARVNGLVPALASVPEVVVSVALPPPSARLLPTSRVPWIRLTPEKVLAPLRVSVLAPVFVRIFPGALSGPLRRTGLKVDKEVSVDSPPFPLKARVP
jgi:hypothetical protein